MLRRKRLYIVLWHILVFAKCEIYFFSISTMNGVCVRVRVRAHECGGGDGAGGWAGEVRGWGG